MAIKWEGVMPAVTTKFDENDQLDLNTFEKNINAQLEAGVSGIILGGTLGEASTLTPKEKENLVKKTLEVVNGKVPVIINIAEHKRCYLHKMHLPGGRKGLCFYLQCDIKLPTVKR